MDYPKHLYRHPGPYGSGSLAYDVAGAADEDQELSLLDRGWYTTKEAAWEADRPNPLDHDGDGRKGGSIDGLDQKDTEELRQMATEKGLKLHHKTGRDKLLSALRESADEHQV